LGTISTTKSRDSNIPFYIGLKSNENEVKYIDLRRKIMFRICSEFSVMFRICSEFSVIFKIFRICSESVQNFQQRSELCVLDILKCLKILKITKNSEKILKRF
jgi:hypothetical protein